MINIICIFIENETGMIFECNPSGGAFLAFNGKKEFVIHRSKLIQMKKEQKVTYLGKL